MRRTDFLSRAFCGILLVITDMQMAMASGGVKQDEQHLVMPNGIAIHFNVQPVPSAPHLPHMTKAQGDVLYVHGATFSSDLSIFRKFDQHSWADAIVDAGFNAWGFDFAGYGRSSRYDIDSEAPRGRMAEALPQLHAVVSSIRRQNGGKKLLLLAHSWGTVVAARYVSENPENVKALVLFGPPVVRGGKRPHGADSAGPPPSHYRLTSLSQYRRFVEDVPRGEAQVLSEAHFESWSRDWLATDVTSQTRTPPSVMTPYGPIADVTAMWSGESLYDAARIVMPVLLVRGGWDSVCDDTDAKRLLNSLGTKDKTDVKIPRATHLMHLESQRALLHNAVNAFLVRVAKE